MNRILLDTNIVSYWHSGEPRFKRPLEKLFRELSKQKTLLYISSITIQEVGYWGLTTGTWPAMRQFLSASRLITLDFCAGCAIRAAKLQADGGPVVTKKSTQEESKAQWHHDAAIVGTAAHHGLDTIVTTDRALVSRYGELFDEIRNLEPAE